MRAAGGENGKGDAAAKGKRERGAVAAADGPHAPAGTTAPAPFSSARKCACEEPACRTRRAAAATAAACAYGAEPATASQPRPAHAAAADELMPAAAVGEPEEGPGPGHELPRGVCSGGSVDGSGGRAESDCGEELLLPSDSEEGD